MKSYWIAKTVDEKNTDYAWFYVVWDDDSAFPPDIELVTWCLGCGIYRPNTTVRFSRLSEDGSSSLAIDRRVVRGNMEFWFLGLLDTHKGQ